MYFAPIFGGRGQTGNGTRGFIHSLVFFLIQIENVSKTHWGTCGNAGSVFDENLERGDFLKI